MHTIARGIALVFGNYIEGVPAPDDMRKLASRTHPMVKRFIDEVLS